MAVGEMPVSSLLVFRKRLAAAHGRLTMKFTEGLRAISGGGKSPGTPSATSLDRPSV